VDAGVDHSDHVGRVETMSEKHAEGEEPVTRADHPPPSGPTETRMFSEDELRLGDINTMNLEVPTKYKIVIVGNSSVGKTSVVVRFTENTFQEVMQATIGVDFKRRPFEFDGHQVSLYLWDTAGQEKLRAVTSQYYRGSVGAIVMYDVTDRKSFADLEVWLDEIDRHTEDGTCKIIVGNKIDDTFNRVVSKQEAQTFARRLQLPYMETSAKFDDGINDTFATLAWHIYNRLEAKHKARKAEEAQTEDGDDRWETVVIDKPVVVRPKKDKCNC